MAGRDSYLDRSSRQLWESVHRIESRLKTVEGSFLTRATADARYALIGSGKAALTDLTDPDQTSISAAAGSVGNADTLDGFDSSYFLNADNLNAGSVPGARLSNAWPINSIYISVVNTNPATTLGFGTWIAFGTGRVLVGFDAGQTEFDTAEETGGAKTHTLTTDEMPAHNHSERYSSAGGAATDFEIASNRLTANAGTSPSTTGSAGGGQAHNNLQPYIVVFFWKRTA
jgi:hypothetical protein